ncbi:hypothetical protein OWM54_04115 [Myxococcus sp. MISCRS1]|uniref:hypothetical protein n=1 Tax=Myxococcus TaxID=32 RepID=UPI00226F2F21|nr:hypothetical protein [Myxococcus sp. MISCRS1]MCY0996313.1 hypothetical protein [Myxococcus sp. MISCRS1]
MPYTDVQFIGYHHQLGYDVKNGGGPHRIWGGAYHLLPGGGPVFTLWQGKGTQSYKGHPNDRTDLTHRCSFVKSAIMRASNSPHLDDRDSTLKVFLMPEFFFRGAKGGYQFDLISQVLSDFRRWTFNARNDRFRGWVFVLGTIIGYLDEYDAVVTNRKTGVEVFNIALIQQGGYLNSDGKHDRLVYKEQVSGIDYINDSWMQVDGPGNVLGRGDNRGRILLGNKNRYRPTIPTRGSHDPMSQVATRSVNRSEWSTNPLQGGCNFRLGARGEAINEVSFGVEVCLDHLSARMKNTDEAETIGELEPMIQLIPSAGMDIKDNAVAVTDTGYVFNVDGLRTPGSTPPAIELKRWDAGTSTTAALEGLGSFAVHSVPNPVVGGVPLNPLTYFASAGNLKIYRARPMPPQVTVESPLAALFGP